VSKQIKQIIIGSRESELALIQSNWVREQLIIKLLELKKSKPVEYAALNLSDDFDIKIVKMSTKGDQVLDVSLSKIGDKGLFTQELEDAMREGRVDCAVHSMKDLPTTLPQGFEIVTTTEREDVRGVLVLSKQALQSGAQSIADVEIIATSSLRRIAQLRRQYPNKRFVDIRGNVNTRLAKLDGEYTGPNLYAPEDQPQAMVLAAAGINRLAACGSPETRARFEGRISEYLDPQKILPAIGQGALAIECYEASETLRAIFALLNSDRDEFMIKAERAFLRDLDGGCQVPIGISAWTEEQTLFLKGFKSEPDGSDYREAETKGDLLNAEALGKNLASKILALQLTA